MSERGFGYFIESIERRLYDPRPCTQNLDVTGIKTEIIAMFKHIKYFWLYMEQYGNYITLNQDVKKDF